MPYPNLPPYQQIPTIPGFPNYGTPNLPPYQPTSDIPWGGMGTPTLPPYEQIPNNLPPWGQGNPTTPTPPTTPTTPTPPTQNNPWNPFPTGGGNGPWSNPFQYPTYGGQYQNWTPDYGEDGAGGFYQDLLSTDDAVQGSAWNDYVKSLANNLLTNGLFSPSQAQTYYGVLNPDMQYGLDPNNDVIPYSGPTNDTQAQQWNSPSYWDRLSQQLSGQMGTIFGGVEGDQTEGNQDNVEKANRWLRDVVDMGRRYSADNPSEYWSTARARDRNEGWNFLSNQAQSLGLGEEFVNLGSSLYNPNVGNGPQASLFNTGSFRTRNQNYR